MNKLEFTNKVIDNLNDSIHEDGKVELAKFIELTNKLYYEAINYTHSCTELKEKKAPTFDEWLKKLKWKQIGSSYTFKRGESYTDAESLLISYKKEYYNL